MRPSFWRFHSSLLASLALMAPFGGIAAEATNVAGGSPQASPAQGISANERAQELVQVREAFDSDPGWEVVNNRVAGENCPIVTQDFGYLAPEAWSAVPGRIGGVVSRSRTPAWYGMKVSNLSFDDALTASGRLILMPSAKFGGAYFGFFNSARQEWRPWSSLALRLGDLRPGPPLSADSHVDYMSAGWKAGGYSVGNLPADGQPHAWSLTYEPTVTVQTQWADTSLRVYLGTTKKPEEALLRVAREVEPEITIEHLRQRLNAEQTLGHVEFHTRRGVGWEIRHEPEKVKGRILFRFGDSLPIAHFMSRSIRDEPVTMDRFGIFNFQLPGFATELYLLDLTVNGQKVDLAQDPDWQGVGNRTQFVEHDFHGKQDFGFTPTNFAGTAVGEIGGTFWRTEPVDPLHAYYADDIGQLTLEDPVSFSGQICFARGGTDAGMRFGYFNSKDRAAKFAVEQGGEAGEPLPNTMSMAIEGPTRIGYYLSAQLCPAERSRASHSEGPVFVPDGTRHSFTFGYDPAANNGVGRITIAIDGAPYQLNLTPEQRRAGANFDRFGIMNLRRGGKYVTVYFDDLTYTARRSAAHKRVRHVQRVLIVPYPAGGRKY